jgi:dynactin-4
MDMSEVEGAVVIGFHCQRTPTALHPARHAKTQASHAQLPQRNMAEFKPYTYFQCPCTDTSIPSREVWGASPASEQEVDEDERTFDPRAPRANYSLYPLEHLLYCEDCHQIRCPRCVLDEIVCWYCPNCLFEVPSSSVKNEGNRLAPSLMSRMQLTISPRCTRSCFQCPICTSPLSISSTEPPPEGLGAEYATVSGTYVLNCAYCLWSSKEIGIELDKPNSVYAQLAKIKNGGEPFVSLKERRKAQEERREDGEEDDIPLDPTEELDAESHFSTLKSFYQEQLAESSPAGALGFTGDYGYGSPGALSRIVGLYTSGALGDRKSKNKSGTMREAHDALEGLQISPLSSTAAIARLRSSGWEGTASLAQRRMQTHDPRFLSDLRPIASLLRTKRSKRCKTCRHILSKPESKVQKTHFRIRLVAPNYIPSIAIRALQPAPAPGLLAPLKPTQFLLTFTNPLFDGVRVSIATPARTPGRFASRVTILCPQFEVGANTDVWDEALGESGSKTSEQQQQQRERERRRTRAEASEGQGQAEAGKIWERGRNWVSVVVEVVPASLRLDDDDGPEFLRSKEETKGERDTGPLREDEDVLEIPVFVRVEWDADVAGDEGGGLAAANKEKEARERRELAYWCVLGVGRIAGD